MSSAVSHKKQVPAFLEKLFEILDENSSYVTLISWQPDGKSFLIKKVNEFSETVLPKYFKHSNIQSCVRQLNMYGFSKTRHGSNFREYSHKMFLRGRKDLLVLIKRKAMSNSPKAAPSLHPNDEQQPLDYIKSESYNGFEDYVDEDEERSEEGENDVGYNNHLNQSGNDMHHHNNTTSDSSYDDYGTPSNTVMQLLQRVDTLEDHIRTITSQYSTLLDAHNKLCDLLNRDSHRDNRLANTSVANSADNASSMAGIAFENDNKYGDCKVEPPLKLQRLSSSALSVGSNPNSPSSGTDNEILLIANGQDVTSNINGSHNSSGGNGHVQQLLPPHHNMYYDFHNPFPRGPGASSSSSSSYSIPASALLSRSLVPYHRQHQGERCGFDQDGDPFQSSSSSSGDGSSGKKRRYSIDIGGLEAISLAATMLDHRAPTAAVMTVSDHKSGEVAAAVMDCDYLLSMCGGDNTLRKAYSIG